MGRLWRGVMMRAGRQSIIVLARKISFSPTSTPPASAPLPRRRTLQPDSSQAVAHQGASRPCNLTLGATVLPSLINKLRHASLYCRQPSFTLISYLDISKNRPHSPPTDIPHIHPIYTNGTDVIICAYAVSHELTSIFGHTYIYKHPPSLISIRLQRRYNAIRRLSLPPGLSAPASSCSQSQHRAPILPDQQPTVTICIASRPETRDRRRRG
jgi:hypothetical protein